MSSSRCTSRWVGVDEHGHAKPLEYQGAPVPKKMNKLGSAGHPLPGSLLKPDPVDETIALERARAEQHPMQSTGEPEAPAEHSEENRELPVD